METGEAIDVIGMTHEMAQSLIDMIMEQDELHQAPLLASVIASYLLKIRRTLAQPMKVAVIPAISSRSRA